MKKTLWMPLVVSAMMLVLSVNAQALLVDELVDEVFSPDAGGAIQVTVTSQVELDQDVFHYTYQITSTDVQVTWFAISLLENNAFNYDAGVGANAPDLWQFVSPMSAEAVFFTDPVNAGEVSAIISFDSREAPVVVSARVAGRTSGSLYGDVLAPIPEPATLALLGFGAAAMVMRRKHN